jgi:hypothetical protein
MAVSRRSAEAEDRGQVAEHGDSGGQGHAERGAVALAARERGPGDPGGQNRGQAGRGEQDRLSGADGAGQGAGGRAEEQYRHEGVRGERRRAEDRGKEGLVGMKLMGMAANSQLPVALWWRSCRKRANGQAG